MKLSNFSNLKTFGACDFATVTVTRTRWFRAPLVTVERVYRTHGDTLWRFALNGTRIKNAEFPGGTGESE